MKTNIFLQQLAQRMDGDRKALSQAQDILRSMIDRKLWKQMQSTMELPLDFEQIETLLEQYNVFFREITLSDGWWTRCTGYLLGFTADDHTPLLLVPGFTDYTFTHPKTGRQMSASKSADMLEKEAIIACLPLTEEKLTVKELIRYAMNSLCKYDLFYSLMACIGVILLTMFTPYVCKLIFSEVIPSGDAAQIVPIATLLFSAAVGLTMVQIARNLVVVRIKDKVEYALQTAMMSRLLQLPASFAKAFTPGDLSNRLLSLSRVSSSLTASFLSTLLTFLFSAIMFVQFFVYGGPLLFTGIIVITLQLVAIMLEYYYTKKVQLNVNDSSSRLIGTLFSLFSGIQKIKTSGAEFRAFLQWAKAYAPSEQFSSRQPLANFYVTSVSYCLKFLPMIVTMGAAWHYGLSLSDYIAYCAVLGLVCNAVLQLQGITKMVARLLPETRLCRPLFTAKTETKEDANVVKSISGRMDVRGLKFRYADDMPLLFDGLDLSINSGDYVALVGASGCGKSTLMRLMLGLEHPLAGSVFYDQYDLSDINLRSLRQHCIGICMQDGQLVEGTIRDNIIFNSPLLTDDDAWEAARLAALDGDIRNMPLGMDTPITTDGKGVSGGQRQRILIARALVRKPKVLFLDEATSALDNISQHTVIENLAKLKCTRIVIAHRLSTIQHCNRIIVLKDGRVAADGNFRELQARGFFRLLVGLLLCMLPLGSRGQATLTLDEVIRLSQDSAITAFQSQQEYRSRQASYDAFEALRKPQLSLKVVPNYSRIVSDPSRDYVYLRNFDILSTSAQLRLSQKVLPFGGEAFVGTQAIWSEFFREEASGHPRQFVASPLLVGYSHSLLGYNPFRWEKKVEDQRLEVARRQHAHNLRCIAEEAAVRYFRLARQQRMLQMRLDELRMNDTLLAIAREKASIAIVSLAELRSIEVQQQNAANLLEVTRQDELKARIELASLLRMKQIPDSIPLLAIPELPPPVGYTPEEAAMLARNNSPAYQQRLAELTEARHQEDKASKERGINVGLDINLGLQQVNTTLGSAYKNQQLYALGAVQVTIPLADHGAAQKRHGAAMAWVERQQSALSEEERLLTEDATVTLHRLNTSRMLLESTRQTVDLAEEVFNDAADNYANGICDINTYTLAQTRWSMAYTNYLTVLEEFWTTHYHLQTLINNE